MFITTTDLDGVIEDIRSLKVAKTEQLFIAVGENVGINIEKLIAALNVMDIRFFGGIFPGVVTGGRKYDKGMVICSLPAYRAPLLIRNIGAGKYDLDELSEYADSHDMSAFVFVDGLTNNIGKLLKQLQNFFPEDVVIAGGGAGSIRLQQMPCVFSSEGLFQDAAVLAVVPRRSFQGVRHGWKVLEGPFIANKTRGNILEEFSWKNALKFYSEIVEKDSGKSLTPENFYSLAMRYPFGIHTTGLEDLVRDPLVITSDGNLLCCGDIPENTVISILRGQDRELIAAADRAAQDCIDKTLGQQVSHAIVVDCISRMYFLGEYFERELDVINSKLAMTAGSPEPMGALTIGEIASYGRGGVELFNKTTVLTVIME